jgi:hypothetical protein
MTASIPAAYGLRGLPGPTGQFVHRGVAWVAHCEPPLGAHGTSSKMRSYFYPSERLSLEPANTIQLARCKVSNHGFCRKLAESERGQAIHPPTEAGGFLAPFL